MMAHYQNLKKKENINYHKANTALQYLKSGHMPFLQRILEQQHVRFILDIQRNLSFTHYSDFAPCSCSLDTLQPAHEHFQGKCPFSGRRKCNCQNVKKRMRCPSGFCSSMYDKLVSQNRGYNPSLTNTNIKEWRFNPLQIALCNICSNVKSRISSLADIDPSGILQILVNDMEVTSDPRLLQLYKEIKRCRDEFTHSANMELDDGKLLSLLEKIEQSLDLIPRSVETDEAKDLISKLREEDWEISSKDHEKDDQSCLEKNKHIQEKIDICKTTVEQIRNRQTDKSFDPLLQSMDDSIREIERMTDGTNKALYSRSFGLENMEKKLALQKFLLRKYQKYLLETEAGITVDEIYVLPEMVIQEDDGKRKKRMTTYNEMFHQGEKRAKNIFIIGRGRSGKTVFLKYLTSIWYQVHSGDALQDSLSEIERIMLKYDFLFYVSLCYEKREQNIHNIIIKQLLEDHNQIEVFEQLMETESHKCLIILDALNEFILVGDKRKHTLELDESKNYTVVMATRPWKTEMIKKEDRKIELTGTLSPFTFVRRVIYSLNKKYKLEKDFMDFLVKFGVQRCQCSELSVLMLHIRLWFDEKDE